MSITSFLQRCNEKTIKVIAGDLEEGFWEYDGRSLYRTDPKGAREEILLNNRVRKVELHRYLQKDQYEQLFGAGVGALVGMRFGLPGLALGAVAGVFMTSPQPEVSVNIELNDGRHFMAVMWPQVFHRLKETAR